MLKRPSPGRGWKHQNQHNTTTTVLRQEQQGTARPRKQVQPGRRRVGDGGQLGDRVLGLGPHRCRGRGRRRPNLRAPGFRYVWELFLSRTLFCLRLPHLLLVSSKTSTVYILGQYYGVFIVELRFCLFPPVLDKKRMRRKTGNKRENVFLNQSPRNYHMGKNQERLAFLF